MGPGSKLCATFLNIANYFKALRCGCVYFFSLLKTSTVLLYFQTEEAAGGTAVPAGILLRWLQGPAGGPEEGTHGPQRGPRQTTGPWQPPIVTFVYYLIGSIFILYLLFVISSAKDAIWRDKYRRLNTWHLIRAYGICCSWASTENIFVANCAVLTINIVVNMWKQLI